MKPDDAVARARELASVLVVQHLSTARYKGADLAVTDMALMIAAALRAERTRALEDAAEMCERDILGGYGHGAARDIRALKEKP